MQLDTIIESDTCGHPCDVTGLSALELSVPFMETTVTLLNFQVVTDPTAQQP